MEKFDTAISTRLLDNGENIATELHSNAKGCRRWMSIFKAKEPHKFEPANSNIPKHDFSILDFELKLEKIDTYFGDEDMLNQKRVYFKSLDELIVYLNDLNISPKNFTYPWKCDYPF